jgi:hypothetical protein
MNLYDESMIRIGVDTLTEPLFVDSIIEAVYQPGPGDAAAPWAVHLVGQRSRWLVSRWIDSGPHAGQWAMAPYPPAEAAIGGSVPLAQLQQARVIGELFDEAP